MLFTNNGVIMFKKIFSFFFIISALLFSGNQTQAMQESEATTVQNTFYCEQEICSILSMTQSETLESVQPICPPLKFLAASEYLKSLKARGQELDTVNTEAIPEDLKIYCKQCYLISLIPFINLIHEHIKSLKQFKKCVPLKITDENLCIYNALLHKLILHIDIHGINIESILSAIELEFQFISNNITLEDINLVLKLLMQSKEDDFPKPEIPFLDKIWNFIRNYESHNHDFILRYDCTDLLKLIAKNRRLLLPLNHICHRNFPETFFMFLCRRCCIDLFKDIINEEKNKNYNWKQLFSVENYVQGQLLHSAAINSVGNQGIFEIILELMKDNDLKLDDFINTQNIRGLTPLMCAAINGNDKIVKLLLDHGANRYILDSRGKTALERAIHSKEDTKNAHKKPKFDRCIELLTPSQFTHNQN